MITFGNEEHFKNFYLQKAPSLISFARKFVDVFTAEDIVHDVFLKAWQERMSLSRDRGADAYLFRMVQNSCIDYLRHKTIEDNFVSKALLELQIEELKWSDSSDDVVLQEEHLKAIFSAIEKLPPKCKTIFTKSYLENQKHSEIADHLQISVRTVEAQVYKALKLIRNSLIHVLVVSFLHLAQNL